jgi:hypothetical protein
MIESLAGKDIQPPDPFCFENETRIETLASIYELLAREEMSNEGDWSSSLDQMLGETIVYQRLLNQAVGEIEDYANRREEAPQWLNWYVIILGCMIQQRLTHIFLDCHPDQFRNLLSIGNMWGMEPKSWSSNMVGAGSAAKAIQELSTMHPKIRIFMPALWEDAFRSTDLLVLHESGQGACVSLKTLRGNRTQFYKSTKDVPEEHHVWWNGIQKGTERFNRSFGRNWIPTLVLVGRFNGGLNDLGVPRNTPSWVRALCKVLEPETDTSVIPIPQIRLNI